MHGGLNHLTGGSQNFAFLMCQKSLQGFVWILSVLQMIAPFPRSKVIHSAFPRLPHVSTERGNGHSNYCGLQTRHVLSLRQPGARIPCGLSERCLLMNFPSDGLKAAHNPADLREEKSLLRQTAWSGENSSKHGAILLASLSLPVKKQNKNNNKKPESTLTFLSFLPGFFSLFHCVGPA